MPDRSVNVDRDTHRTSKPGRRFARRATVVVAMSLCGWLRPGTVTAQSLPRPSLALAAPQAGSVPPTPISIPPALDTACVRCHTTSLRGTMRVHLREWARSPHAAHGIGCHDCHGGDPRQTDVTTAHAPTAADEGLSGPQHADRLCVRCHAESARAFERNPHYALIQAGDRLMPGCVTCHGAEGVDPISPERLEAVCNQCHGPGSSRPHPGAAGAIRLLLVEQQSLVLLQAEVGRLAGLFPPGATRARVEATLAEVSAILRADAEAEHSGEVGTLAAQLQVLYRRTLDAAGLLLQPPEPKR